MTSQPTKTQRNYGHIRGTNNPDDKFVVFTDEHIKAFNDFATARGIFPKKKTTTTTTTTKTVFDLRTIVKLPQALSNIDQGSLGSCTANAIAFAYAFDEIKQGNTEVFLPSRLFIYYNERLIEGTVNQDAGAQIRDGIKSINTYGVCDESHWIYDPVLFAEKPPQTVYDEAKLAKSVAYAQIDFSTCTTIAQRVTQIKTAIQSGYPVVFGFTVFASFESQYVAATGNVPMPSPNEQVMGGHAVCTVGFDDGRQAFIVKNSWGANWGLNGYCYIPYNYLGNPNLASDFWVIQKVTNPNNIPNFKPSDINPNFKDLNVQPSSGGVVN